MTVLGHAHFDNVKETTTTTGTGAKTLAGAAVGFRALSTTGIADRTVVPVSIRGGAEFETGLYRYSTGGNTLTLVEIMGSSNAGAAVNFSAGVKDVIIGPVARHLANPLAAFPFSAGQTPLRVNLILSTLTFTSKGFISKITDLSGNGHDSATNTTNPPKYFPHAINGLPAAFFNLGQRWTFPGVPQLAAPLGCCIYGIGSAWGVSGNSHVYNYAGNPIGFGSTTPLDLIYNGTLPNAHADAQAIVQDHRPDSIMGYACGFIHVYNGASSINGINGNEQVVNTSPGTVATGVTNSFTIGGDSSTGGSQYCRMALQELGILNFVPSATERGDLWSYIRAMGRLGFV